ncbi:xanthine dehydrogenase family protein molybdopterin-binding subunit [Denitrobaculum tricleocarpae]|uniref:Xanthine dehydrogenase family protein molybdopterin-binding subunit n=1 Tax=Denitrobaculum tricleocarpae TaxID=2591009 RepID=A0A545U346_9PROT|nr:xanthine dehydrogenase family protein molybdopterin-binding subunit [Denitrobaculum tricleocarpae]TQV83890.1 xanthine dehydrogenase family protein molybdopterin-binding subunit [Denitrobaculum tricleocarpae]
MVKFGVGQGLRRVEDERLLTGYGRYTDDIKEDGEVFGYVLRSPYAHADIRSMDLEDAKAAPGVLGVYSHEDLTADGVQNIPCMTPIPGKNGTTPIMPPRPALANGRVRHIGDPVAFVVAETLEQARDAAELIFVDYADLPANVRSDKALEASTPQVWDEAPGNLCLDWEEGDRAATEAVIGKAHKVVRLELINNRVVVNAMEPRGALASYDPESDQMTLVSGSQGVFSLRNQLAERIFQVPPEKIRVRTQDVGGGFGMKIFVYPEQVLVMFAARRLKRPVRWTGDRSESFMSDSQGRDHVTSLEAGLDENGKIIALKVLTIADLGAYLSNFGPYIPTLCGSYLLCGVYTIPTLYVEVKCVFTNTVPVDAYRGAGRPEAAYAIERLIDYAAREIAIAPDEMRRRNFIPPDAMPFKTCTGITYDTGDFAQIMRRAQEAAGWGDFEARRAEAKTRGKLRGQGMASYIEACGGIGEEEARIKVNADGGITLFIGTQNNGQGHATAYAQIIGDRLGLEPEQIELRQGDTNELASGGGTGGSRSVLMGGMAITGASEKVIARAREIAGHLLEAATDDIEYNAGILSIAGTDRRVSLADVAQAAQTGTGLPPEAAEALKEGIDETAKFTDTPPKTYPNGSHICEVEIDAETGVAKVVRYVIYDDFGTVINPLMAAGQVHGGTVQGIGQALLEQTVYDPETGQLLTGSYLDYCMPRADDIPDIELTMVEDMPCATNDMGMKGAGEAGCIGAPPAVINAIVDALAPLGVRHVDMPATPEKIWRLIQSADANRVAAE